VSTVKVSASQAASGVLLAGGATASQTDLQLTDIAGSRVVFVLNTATASGGNTVQIAFNGITASNYVYPLLTGVAVAAVAVTPYRIGMDFTPSANAVANDAPPRVIQAVVTVVGTVAYGIDWFVLR
jgi:hypothetical protein